MIPSDRRYAESHEWVKLEDGVAIIGISDYAQNSLGDITYVDLPEIDDEFEQDGECAVVESVKAASDLYAPMSGKVIEVNDALDGSPELINEDPYGEGWIFKLKPDNEEEYEDLLDAADYESMNEDDDDDE